MNTDQIRLETLNGISGKSRLEAYLKFCDGWTDPKLSRRVDLPEFAEKILLRGKAVMAVNASHLDVGLAAFYCNDAIKHRAFLTHLAVSPEYRGCGVGKMLLDSARVQSSSAGMKSMRLEVQRTNKEARRFYESLGFVEVAPDPANSTAAGSIFMVSPL